MAERSLQQLLITNFALGPSGYTGSRGDAGYTGSGGGSSAPTIATIGYVGDNTATNTAGGETVSLTGTGFVTGCSIIINGSPVGAVSFISATQVTFVAPALAAGTYILYLVNTNGATAISVPGISYSGVPSFYTGAGSVGTVYEASSFNSNVSAVGDSAITYSIASGLLPTGATLNANGVITGTSVLTGNSTTYTFGVTASDGQNQDVTRTYTITVNPDTVTWSSPANSATVSLGINTSTTTTLTAISAAGKDITYTANTLPTGLSIVGSAVTGTPTTLGNTTSVLTANATSTTRSATITVVWNIAVLGDPYFAYNSLLLSGNGSNNATNNTFVDSSTNNFSITRAGNTTQGTFSPYGPNWSNYFNGSTDWLTTGSAVTALGSGNWTVEFWFYTTVSSVTQVIADTRSSSQGLYPLFKIDAANKINLYINTNDALTSTNTIIANVWNHVAFVKNSTTTTCYINGVANGTYSDSNTYLAGVTTFGASGLTVDSHSAKLTGYISNYRTVVGTAVYTSAFTPPTIPLTAISGTALLISQSNRFRDNSTNNLAITPSGTTSIQRFSPFSPGATYSAGTIGGSAYFDGTGDYLTYPSNAVAGMNFGSGDFTVEGWIYPTATPGDGGGIFGGTSGSTSPVLLGYNSSIGSWGFGRNFVTWDYSFSQAPILNTWQHLAVSRTGTTLRLFFNGVLKTTVTTSQTYSMSGGGTQGFNGSSGYVTGYISDARATNTALYTATFTPSTTPLTAIANTSLLTNFTNAGIIDNAMMNNLETIGNAKISTTQSKFGGSSMAFDGTSGSRLLPAASANFAFGTGDFTIESWIYTNTISGGKGFFQLSDTVGGLKTSYTSGIILTLGDANNGAMNCNVLNTTIASPNSSIAINTWYHVAVTRQSGSVRLFINGVLVGGPTTVSGSITAQNIVVGGYYDTNYLWNGYLDDFRVTKGYARYTANFTPPSAALGTQ